MKAVESMLSPVGAFEVFENRALFQGKQPGCGLENGSEQDRPVGRLWGNPGWKEGCLTWDSDIEKEEENQLELLSTGFGDIKQLLI